MDYHFGKGSLKQLSTCHKDLQILAAEALKLSVIDFKIVEGHRSLERQSQLFKEGKTKINGIDKKGKHNHLPSLAFDIAAVLPQGLSWERNNLCFIAGVILSTGTRLLMEGKISHKIRWGGNWDSDGEIITDQRFIDLPHFELV